MKGVVHWTAPFCVEHLVKASRKTKLEVSANHTCTLNESKLKTQLEFSVTWYHNIIT